MEYPNASEGNMAVESCLLLLDHGIDLDNTLVVSDEGTEQQKADRAHESSDLEHYHTPVVIAYFKLWWDYVPSEDKTMGKYHC